MSTPSLFRLTPGKPSYQISDRGVGRSVAYDNLPPNFGKGIPGAPYMLATLWETDLAGYTYARAFWRSVIFEGSLPFYCRLVFPRPTLTKHLCAVVPGTWTNAAIDGEKFSIQATLEISRIIVP